MAFTKKVYKVRPTYSWAWGCVLIAAFNKDQAAEHIPEDEHTGFTEPELVKDLYYKGKSGVILNEYVIQ